MRSLLMLALLLFVVVGVQPRFQAQAQTESMHGNREVLIASSDLAAPTPIDAERQAPAALAASAADGVHKTHRPNLMAVLTRFAQGLSGGLALTIFLGLAAITMPRVSWGLREARTA